VCQDTAPTKVADVYTNLATDIDATYLYASERSQAGVSQIVRYQKSSNTKTVLFESLNTNEWIYALIVAGNFVYFGETFYSGGVDPASGQVSRISTSGVKQTATAVSADSTFGFAKNATRVFWTTARRQTCVCSSPAPTKIWSTPIGGTTATQFWRVFNGVELSPDIEVTDQYLYVWDLSSRMDGAQVSQTYSPFLEQYDLSDPTASGITGVISYFIENAVPYELTSGFTRMPGLTKNGSAIYGNVNVGSTSGGTLYQSADNLIFKYSGGAVTRITRTSTIGLTSNFVADGQNVYIEDMTIPDGGGSLSYWTNHQLMYQTLSIDGTDLYFGSWGYWNSLPYDNAPDVNLSALFKVAK